MPGRTNGKQFRVRRPSRAPDGAGDTSLYSYACDAGADSVTFAPTGGGRWRLALLGTVAAGALMFGYGRSASAQVTPPDPPCDAISGGGTTVTCTGDVSEGVLLDNRPAGPYSTLNVNTLTENIEPAVNVEGIEFISDGEINLNSNTGSYTITVTGAATGVRAAGYGTSTVNVNHTGDITSEATGLFARSLDSAGPDSGAVDVYSNGTINAGNGAGADGISASSTAIAGDSSNVDVVSIGDVTTGGRHGIAARSTINTGTTGDVTVNSTGDVTTTGVGQGLNRVAGIYATTQASSLAGGNVGSVDVASVGEVNGTDFGILASAIARNGGNAGAVSIDSTGDVNAISGIANRGSAIVASSTTPDGDTGDATVISDGNLTATEDGIFAQSSAGNGGPGTGTAGKVTVESTGDIDAGDFGIDARATNITTAGNAGDAMVTSTGNITAGTVGIRASSGVKNGNAGKATVINDGNVISTGQSGIEASSTTNTGGAAKEVTIVTSGDVRGRDQGISATSRGAAGNGNIDITINSGTVSGTAGNSLGIFMIGGVDNTVLNYGTVTSASNRAIYSSPSIGPDANDTVDNRGNVIGNVRLLGGTNAFMNRENGNFESGAIINLDGGQLTNDGNLSPGGTGTIQTSALTGDFVQNAGGTFSVDANFSANQADLVTVSGTADLAGTVVVNHLDADQAAEGQQVTILSTANAGDLTDSGIGVQDSLLVDFELLIQNNQDLLLTIAAIRQFLSIAGLNQNQTSIATNIQEIQNAGGSPAFDPIINALLLLPDLPSLQNALDQLSPEAYLDTQITALYAALDFSNNLFSCPVSQGQFAFIREGQCVWVEGGIRSIDQNRTPENFNFDEHTGNVSAGAQIALGSDWFLGGALGYEWGEFDTDTAVRSDLDRFSGGVALKYNPGPWLLAGAVSGGGSWYDTTRNIAFTGFEAKATSDHEVTHGSGQLRAAYLVESGAAYLKPMVDLNATYIELDSITEMGGGAANLNVSGTDDWVFSVSPALELGAQMGDEHDLVMVRPFVRAGITALDDTNFQISSTFAAAPVAPFIIRNETDDLTYDVSGGADFFTHGNASLRVAYDGKFGDDVEVHSGSIRGRLGF